MTSTGEDEGAGVVDLIARVIARRDDPSDLARATKFAAELLEREGLDGLARTDASALTSRLVTQGYRGGRAAGVALAAAFELGRRMVIAEARSPPRIAESADVAAWATPRLVKLTHEELWVLALDGRSRLRAARCVAKGGLHGLAARPPDVLRTALRADASAIVLVHNHPSGDPRPSPEDVAFTHAVAIAAQAVGVPLVDHVVVAREGFASVPSPSSSELEGDP
jgi:DNA repair protein RadC